LQREKQAREDAERREKELHDRLQRFQDEAKAAQEGTYATTKFQFTGNTYRHAYTFVLHCQNSMPDIHQYPDKKVLIS